MSRQDSNAAFAQSSFLYGGNAPYVEDLHARYERDPQSVDPQWQAFFQSLKDDPGALKSAQGPSWQQANWPALPRDDLTSALDGDWPAAEAALGDKIKTRARAPRRRAVRRRGAAGRRATPSMR